MEEKIIIKNDNLANYIMFKLDKTENGFTEEELDKITEIVIDYSNETDSSFVFLEELLKLNNLKFITLRNGYIFNDNYKIFIKLHNLDEFVFERCEFENADLIASLNLRSLSLINCKIENYSFVNLFKNLVELSIVNGIVEIEKLNMLNQLKYLQLSYSNIVDSIELKISSLEELHIDNTNISSFNFLHNLTNIKKISIDENQYNKHKELFNNLIKNNILILNENMVKFGGEDSAL